MRVYLIWREVFDVIGMRGMDRNGNVGMMGERLGYDSFFIVYK